MIPLLASRFRMALVTIAVVFGLVISIGQVVGMVAAGSSVIYQAFCNNFHRDFLDDLCSYASHY